MKKVYIQKEVIGWEEYTYEVEDDFTDYDSLVDSIGWIDWEYLVEASQDTGIYKIYDENYNEL